MNFGLESLKLNISLGVFSKKLKCYMVPSFGKIFKRSKNLFNKCARYKTGDGYSVSFWGDIWLGDCPLKIKYKKLFNIC